MCEVREGQHQFTSGKGPGRVRNKDFIFRYIDFRKHIRYLCRNVNGRRMWVGDPNLSPRHIAGMKSLGVYEISI